MAFGLGRRLDVSSGIKRKRWFHKSCHGETATYIARVRLVIDRIAIQVALGGFFSLSEKMVHAVETHSIEVECVSPGIMGGMRESAEV